MIFTSLTFLGFFILLLLSMLFVRQSRHREYLLLAASYIFYGAWNPVFVLLIVASSLWGWYLGLLMHRAKTRAKKKQYMWLSIFLSLGMLAYFKYANFFVDNVRFLFGVEWQYVDVTLPVGISFFTFQTMSYTIDLYRERISVCRQLHRFMLFVAFFPQLVAGPIVRATEFLPQLERDIRLKASDMLIGGQIFLGGAIQKVLIADNLSVFVDPVFSEPELYSGGTLWLAMAAYGMQIFGDFSGYSLMAIGVARVLGFQLPKNFNMPYVSRSITEFWRRWHMTLSFWLRDYLYIPLGGNRKGVHRTYVNLFITMLLGGLWHGASWNFVVWGALHGSALAVHKLWDASTGRWEGLKQTLFYSLLAWITTLLLVGFLWVPFRSESFSDTMLIIGKMLSGGEGIQWFSPTVMFVLGVSVVWHLLFLFNSRLLTAFPTSNPTRTAPAFAIGATLIIIAMFAPINTSPFIYFQF